MCLIDQMDYESIVEAALKLDAEDRCRVAGRLWESVGDLSPELEEAALESELARREAELEADPSKEVSHEDFLLAFAKRRK